MKRKTLAIGVLALFLASIVVSCKSQRDMTACPAMKVSNGNSSGGSGYKSFAY